MADQNPSSPARSVERLLRHDALIVLGGVAFVVIIAAWYTIAGIGMQMSAVEMTRMARPIGEPMRMGPGIEWTPGRAVLVFLMWWVMMIAMMTPSATPALLLYARIKGMGPDRAIAGRLAGVFLAGYLLIWAGFSVAATLAQWGLGQLDLTSDPMMTLSAGWLSGALLLAAGFYQFSNLKRTCLKHCSSPAEFLVAHNRPGPKGALTLGAHHGIYCIGCCWALMALLFVGGVMNLYWIIGIALYVAAEKLLPDKRWLAPALGAVLIIAGGLVLTGLSIPTG
ncbi:DUF2182 domain-containing protein [Ruegeria aquimaris]|uniref:DUF2182 domain-containing protein n=1 Tax=Ruegeria aquimaris TaxID=2984333 RepID=A0ABT3AIQ8_9RHOB|nr:DUF2182 domain-containing protein [Ruegeria sp. XHP0148]MCV2888172.1 DUF2182 domain-containing protein [Ruegeria sp. XHP0148]